MFLFPFDKVSKNDKIVIYGAGNVARDYYIQIKNLEYCKILFPVDRNYKNISFFDYEVKGLDSLQSNEYDKVVIAVFDKNTTDKIVCDLKKIGVSEEKIVRGVCEIEKHTQYSLKDIIENSSNIRKVTDEFILRADGDISFFKPILTDINNYNFNEDVLPKIKEYIKTNNSVIHNVIILRALFDTALFDKEMCSLYMRCIRQIDNIELKYLLATEISFLLFRRPQDLYDNYYIDRREILKDICKSLNLKIGNVKDRANNKKKIAIMTRTLYGETCSVTKMVILYANILNSAGYEVTIFPNDFYIKNDLPIKPQVMPIGKSRIYKEYHRANLDNNINIKYADDNTETEQLSDRMQKLLDSVTEYNPDCIIDMSDETNVLSYILYKHFPMLSIPSRGYVSSLFFHKFIAINKEKCIEINKVYNSVGVEQMLDLDVCIPFPKAVNQYTRTQFGFNKEDYLLITVGNRLKYELSNEFIDTICGILYNSNIKWIVVCPNNIEYLEKEYESLIKDKKVILWGYENDLVALYRICDVFVNPDRNGGGFSILWAMKEGLPIAATNRVYGDVSRCLEKYAVHGGYDKMVEFILKLKNDEEYYKNVSKDVKKIVNDEKSNTAINFIMEVDKLIESWNENNE